MIKSQQQKSPNIFIIQKMLNFQIESRLKHSYMVNRIDQRKTYVCYGLYFYFFSNMFIFKVIIVM